jgi:hypothetical protein
VKGADLDAVGGRRAVTSLFLETARAAADYYIDGYSALDGVPYWDSCALNTHKQGDFAKKKADPYNAHEPVDSSAAAITAQGLIRLGNYLTANGDKAAGQKIFPGRTHHRQHPLRRALPLDRQEAPGPPAAQRVSPPERLGSHRARARRCPARIFHVG